MNVNNRKVSRKLLRIVCSVVVVFSIIVQPIFGQSSQIEEGGNTTTLLKEVDIYSDKILIFLSFAIFVFFLFSFSVGYKVGLVMQLLGLGSFKVFSFLSNNIKDPLTGFLKLIGFKEGSDLLGITTTLVMLFCVFLVIFTVNYVIRFILGMILLGHLNKILGGLLGLFEACVVLGYLFMFLEGFGVEIPKGMIVSGDEMKYIAKRIFDEDFLAECKELGKSLFERLSEARS